jgi:hypothetical protein
MAIGTTNTVLDHTTDAAFRTWAAEYILMLFTTLGLTQTADTGQINTATVTRPGTTQTSGGYVTGRFNDTLQSTAPVFFKMEFGTGSSTTSPAMWLTVGTGTNGSGTLTGIVSDRFAISGAAAASSIVTPFISAGCYNATAGFLGVSWKLGFQGAIFAGAGGFAIVRSADSTGAATGESIMIVGNGGNSANGSTSSSVPARCISYTTSTFYPFNTTPINIQNAWAYFPMHPLVTLSGGNIQTGLCFQYTPVMGIMPWLAIVLTSEWGVNSTNTMTIVGSTPHTYRNVGSLVGSNSSMFEQQINASTYNLIMLWEP